MPSNFFKKLRKGAASLSEDFVGPDYNYVEYIKQPEKMGMSDKGELGVLAKDIAGLVSYGDILVKGTGNAKIGDKDLGNQFFLNTGSTCMYKGNKVKRYVYVNNQSTGAVPFIPGKSAYFKGLLPGMIENLGAFNPMSIMQGMAQTEPPECTKIRAPVTKNGPNATHHVAIMDLPLRGLPGNKKLNLPRGVTFYDDGNRKALKMANEPFSNMNDALYGEPFKQYYSKINLYDNPFANIYTAGYSFFLIYLYFQLIKRLN